MEVRVVLYEGHFIAHSYSKRFVKWFLEDFEDQMEKIEVVKMKMHEDLTETDEFYNKEIYYDDAYGVYTTTDILMRASNVCDMVSEACQIRADRLRDNVELLKLNGEEEKIVTDFINYLSMIHEDMGCAAYYGDYFDVQQILKQCVYNSLNNIVGEEVN